MKRSVGIFITLFTMPAPTTIQGPALAADLIVGRNTDVVGNVSVSKEGDYVRIKYEITDPNWCMTKTHLPEHHCLEAFRKLKMATRSLPVDERVLRPYGMRDK